MIAIRDDAAIYRVKNVSGYNINQMYLIQKVFCEIHSNQKIISCLLKNTWIY